LTKKKPWNIDSPKPGVSGRRTRASARTSDETPKSGLSGFSGRRPDRPSTSDTRSVIGTGSGVSGLAVAAPRKWLYATYFSTTTTTDTVSGFITSTTNCEDIKCKMLMPKSVSNVSDLVSFKIGVTSEVYEKLYCPTFWPAVIMKLP
jgi:hypothetical protein